MTPSIPNFKLLWLIGEGGFGEVWLGQTVTEKLRAVKWVRRARFERAGLSPAGVDALFRLEFEGVQRFEDIAAVTPELVTIHLVGRSEDGAANYYVMPLADDARQGEGDAEDLEGYRPLTLESWLDANGAMGWEESIGLVASVARGADALHREGLQHGDITSANVLYIDGKPVLADPGLTSLEGAGGESRSRGFSKEEGDADRNRDVFALGRLFYHAVSGEHPAESFPVVPAARMAEIPVGEFAEILDLCCDPDPKGRFENPGALLDWLRERYPDEVEARVVDGGRSRWWVFSLAVAAVAALWTWIAWPEALPYDGLPVRGIVGPIDHLAEEGVWRYAVVGLLDDEVAEDAWRYGRGPFHFGTAVRELPKGLSFVEGKAGQALDFDQEHAGVHTVGGYVELPPVSGEFSVAMWVRWDGDPQTTHHGCVWSVGILPEPQLRLTVNNSGLVYPIYGGEEVDPAVLYDDGCDLSDGQWRHLAVTLSKRSMCFYVDGKLAGEEAITKDPGFAEASQFLGYHQWIVGRATRFWGALDDVCWVPRVLDAQEVAALEGGELVDLNGGFLLGMDGAINAGSDGDVPGVYGRSGAGDDGTRVRGHDGQDWLRLEKAFVTDRELKRLLATLDRVGLVRMELDGSEIELGGEGGTEAGPVFKRLELGDLQAGAHELKLWLSPGGEGRAGRVGLRF